MSDNWQIIRECIWNDPSPVFGVAAKRGGNGWNFERGTYRLTQTRCGYLWVHGNSGSGFADQHFDVFDYLRDYVLHTADRDETLERCAQAYGVKLEHVEGHAEKIQRQRLAREVANSFITSLMGNKTGEVWEYLTNVRKMEPDGVHFGELTPESLSRAKEQLTLRGLSYSDADFEALGLTEARARQGYKLVIPYYKNGVVVGFLFRDVTGTKTKDKYLYSAGLPRGGYCERLNYEQPTVLVEGEMDALRLMAAGVSNVVAMGGSKMSEEVSRLIAANDTRQVIYIPDTEYNEQGEKITKRTSDAIKAFQDATMNDKPIIENVYIVEVPTPEGVTLSKYKIDADDYGKTQGGDALRDLTATAIEWWDYELETLDKWIGDTLSKGETLNKYEVEHRFFEIYNRANPTARERIRQSIEKSDIYKLCGITPFSLRDKDELKRQDDYTNRIKAAADDLRRAVERGANPAVVGEILAKMSEAQGSNTRDEWEKQINATFEDELQAIREQHETLRTKWELGNLNKNGEFVHYEWIEYYPADITVFCAPTSHGKTMILFQSVLDLIKRDPDPTNKVYLYVSCEENKRQLLERALNVFLPIETYPEGKDNLQNICFRTGTRKSAIKAAIRGGYVPNGYTPKEWEVLSRKINEGVQRYAEQIRPHLQLIHTEGTAESIAANVRHYVEHFTEKGLEVCGVFVDYMQLLTSESNSFSRHDELKDVCKALKDCAARTELPIVIAAQLNRETLRNGLDSVTVANIGEGADIERIAHDIYFVWQVDKTKRDMYITTKEKDGREIETFKALGERSRRIFTKSDPLTPQDLKKGCLYVEQMKARDGKTDGWGLFPFDGECGRIYENNQDKMRS